MVEIYAPSCGHCKDFKDKYDEIGQKLFDNSPRYFAAKIDGHKYKEIYNRFNPPGYPHFVFFKRGRA
jgi:thiol-disulfide isomerase/thioredoxin